MNFIVCGTTSVGNVRIINQDNFYCDGCYRRLEEDVLTLERNIVDTRQWIAAVFDGLGGETDGEIASLIASETTKEIYDEKKGNLNELITVINDRICREREKRKSRMGSTCAFLEFNGSRCRSWNVGDSRVYYFSNGKLTQLSADHTEAAWYADYFNDSSILKTTQESKLTQCLGIPENEYIIEPSVSPWKTLETHSIMLLCSDGLTRSVDDECICSVLKSNETLRKKCKDLLDLALKHGSADNITIMMIGAN